MATDGIQASEFNGGSLEIKLNNGELVPDGSVVLDGASTIEGDGTIVATGTIELESGALIESGTGGGLTLFAFSIQGNLAIAASSYLDLDASVLAGTTVDFDPGSMQTLRLEEPAILNGILVGFSTPDTIEIPNMVTTSAYANGTLTLGLMGGITANIAFDGNYTLSSFRILPDGLLTGGSKIVLAQNAELPSVIQEFTPTVNNTIDMDIGSLENDYLDNLNVDSVSDNGQTSQPVTNDLNVLVLTTADPETSLDLPDGFPFGYLFKNRSLLDETNGNSTVIDAADDATIIGSSGDVLFGGNGNETMTATSGAESLFSGTGTNLIELGASTAQMLSQGSDTIIGSTASATVNATGAPLYFGASGTTLFDALGAGATLVGGGATTVNAGPAAVLDFAGSGALSFIAGSAASTVVGGSGGAALTGGSAGMLYFGTGPTTYTPGSAVDTVIGFTGSITATGDANGTLFFTGTGGANEVTTGAGSSSILGFGTGDDLVATGMAGNVIAASGAASTVDGTQSSGSNTFFAFGTNDVLLAGTGATALESGVGNQTLAGGAGGSTLFDILDSGQREVVIQNFDPTRDFVELQGYAGGAAAAALGSATMSGNSEVLTLSDGTTLTFQGVSVLGSGSFLPG